MNVMSFDQQSEAYAFAYRYLHTNGVDSETCHDFANYVVNKWRDESYDEWLNYADMSSEYRRFSICLVAPCQACSADSGEPCREWCIATLV